MLVGNVSMMEPMRYSSIYQETNEQVPLRHWEIHSQKFDAVTATSNVSFLLPGGLAKTNISQHSQTFLCYLCIGMRIRAQRIAGLSTLTSRAPMTCIAGTLLCNMTLFQQVNRNVISRGGSSDGLMKSYARSTLCHLVSLLLHHGFVLPFHMKYTFG